MVSDFYPPLIGGVEVALSTMARELATRGHEVAVATLAVPGQPDEELDQGVRVYRIRSSTQRVERLYASGARPWAPPAPDPAVVLALRGILRRERPEVVHGHDWLARSFLPLKRRSGAACVMSLHYFSLSCPKKSLLYLGDPCSGPGLRKCLACAGRHYGPVKGTVVVGAQFAYAQRERALVDLFLPVSESAAAGNGLRPGGLPYEVLPNPVPDAPDASPHEQLLAQLPGEPFFLFVGDARPAKGVRVLLDAYARLDDPPPLVLLAKVWPDTPTDLPPGVRVLTDWPNAAVRAAMRRCLALVAPSVLPEPFGIVIVEAFTAGKPVVASAIGGMPEIARDGREGLLVAPADPTALAGALERMIRDTDLRARLAENAARRANDYSAAVVMPKLEAAYERVVAR